MYFAEGGFKGINLPRKIYWKEASWMGVTRLTVNPFHDELEHHDLHVGAVGRYSSFTAGGTLRQHPEAYFAAKYVETGPVEGDGVTTFNLEFAYRYKSLIITSEFTQLHLRNPAFGNPFMRGHYLQGDFLLTGERRTYRHRNATFGPPIPRKNVQNRGPDAIELSLRYSGLYTNKFSEAMGAPGESGDMSKLGACLTWYPTILSKFQFGYNYVILDRFGLIGHSHIYQL
jgi:hypothetical protein